MRVKESEIQYLKQEISSLKDELQTALRVMAPAVGDRSGDGLRVEVPCTPVAGSSRVDFIFMRDVVSKN